MCDSIMRECKNWSSDCNFLYNEEKRCFEAMSKQELEDKREGWRQTFYQKFAINENWAEMDETFWDNNLAMMKGAKAIFEMKMKITTAAQGAAQVTPTMEASVVLEE